MSSSRSRVLSPSVKRSRRIINGHKVQSFQSRKFASAISSEQPEPKAYLGTVSHVSHDKTTFAEAIERAFNQQTGEELEGNVKEKRWP